MKRFFITLCVSLLVMSVKAQEIDLTPTTYGTKNAQDTSQVMFCFTRNQLKEIARVTTKGYFSAQTVTRQEGIISHQQASLHAKDQIILNQKEEKKLLSSQITARDSTIAGQQNFIVYQKSQLNEQVQKTLRAEKKANRRTTIGIVSVLLALIAGTQL